MVARAELENAGATLKMETVVPELTSLLCEKAFRPCECGQISPCLCHIVHHHPPILTFPQSTPSSHLTCTNIHQIFQKVKLDISKSDDSSGSVFSSSLVRYNRFNFSTSITLPVPFLPIPRHLFLFFSSFSL